MRVGVLVGNGVLVGSGVLVGVDVGSGVSVGNAASVSAMAVSAKPAGKGVLAAEKALPIAEMIK